jgi:acetyltransferase-like isoleucine patch superfamily enzyme
VRQFQSHGDGEVDLRRLHAVGTNVIFERGAMIFHAENITIGSNVYIGHYALLKGYHRNEMRIGDNVWIGQHAFLHSAGGLTIGNNVGIGPAVRIHTARHEELGRVIPIVFADVSNGPVLIEDDSNLGVGSIVMPGVTIGRGAQVAAGAVVTRNVEPYAVVAGVPARLLRHRPL